MIGIVFLFGSIVLAAFGFIKGIEFASGLYFAPLALNPSFAMELALTFANTVWFVGCGLLGLALFALPCAMLAKLTIKPGL